MKNGVHGRVLNSEFPLIKFLYCNLFIGFGIV